MSDWRRPSADLWATLRGDWWWYAGAFFAFNQLPYLKAISRDNGGIQTVALISEIEDMAQSLGEISFAGSDNETHIYVTFTEAEQAARFWHNAVQTLKQMSASSRQFRQEDIGVSAEDVIEIYYRRRAAGTKVTLQQLATEFKLHPSYLRNAKSAYDKAGKWGSKKAR